MRSRTPNGRWSALWPFATAAEVIGESSPATVEKLRRASPHWMRHTHASHSLARGAELTKEEFFGNTEARSPRAKDFLSKILQH